jgi:hypothetical protein
VDSEPESQPHRVLETECIKDFYFCMKGSGSYWRFVSFWRQRSRFAFFKFVFLPSGEQDTGCPRQFLWLLKQRNTPGSSEPEVYSVTALEAKNPEPSAQGCSL